MAWERLRDAVRYAMYSWLLQECGDILQLTW